MFGLFRAVVDRVKALLVLKAVEELEAESAADAAGRQALLLDAAAGYDRDGKPGVAAGLRAQALRPDSEWPMLRALGTGGGAGGIEKAAGGDKPAKRLR